MARSLANLMGLGMGAQSATLINGIVADGLASTGTTQADALSLPGDVNVVALVVANSGVLLPAVPQPSDEIEITNLGANALLVYPSPGGSVQGGAANTPFSLPSGATATFIARAGSANWIALASSGSAAPPPTLGTLALSATTFTVGTPSSGTITGATVGSAITTGTLPTGLTINGVARSWAWDGTGTAGSGSFTLTETLAGAVGSPKTTTINYTINASAGTLSAPVLGYPSPLTTNPTTIAAALGNDWQVPDTFNLAYSASSSMASPTVLSHSITDAEAVSKTATGPLPSFSGITFLQAYGTHSGAISQFKSNIVAWGYSTAPVITTSATQSVSETALLSIALTATDSGGVPAVISDGTVPGWYISAGPDQLQFEIAIVAGAPVLRWVNNGAQNTASPNDQGLNNVYNVTVTAINYAGKSTPEAIAVTVTAIDQTPDAFSFTNVNNATLSTLYTSNTVTLTGLSPGFNIPSSLSGAGFTYSKNGGPYQPAGSFTVQNGDTISLQVTSSSSYSTGETGVLSIGLGLGNWSVTTQSNPSAAGFTLSTNQAAPSNNSYASNIWTFSSIDFVVGGKPVVFVYCHDTATISSVVVKAAGASGADISLTQRLTNSGGFGTEQVWTSDTAIVAGAAQQVVVTTASAESTVGLTCGTLTNATTSVPSATGVTNFASIASPVTVPAFTVPSLGVGITFWVMNGATPYTANTGTLLVTYANQAETGTNVAVTQQLTAGSWTPSLSYPSSTSASSGFGLAWAH